MEAKFVDIKGIRTRYLEAGTGEALLLVHGGEFGGEFGSYCSANDWDLNIGGFARSFHVFAIDKIGCGFTDNPKSDDEYIIGTAVQHAYDFLNTMKIDRAHVLGHSRGGYTVCRVALEHPKVVNTLTIVASATLATDIPGPLVYGEWKRLAALIKDPRDRHRYLMAANSYGSRHLTDDFVDVGLEIVALPKTKEAKAKMEGGLKVRFDQDLVARQKETHEWIKRGGIKAPTLIVWGFNDPSAKFDPVGLGALQLIFPSTPQSQFHILNHAGHFCYRDQPEAFVEVVTGFIKSNSRLP